MQPSCNLCIANEISMLQITEMLIRQSAPLEILRALCQYAGQPDAAVQVAFFLLEGPNLTLAAKGKLSPQAEVALARIDPAFVSDALFEAGLKAAGQPVYRFDEGWVRHLHSGAGELLGMIAGFCDGPALHSRVNAVRIELICQFAILAMEQVNLMGDLAFQAGQDFVPRRDLDAETSLQEVTQMIARQCSLADILAVLCTHAGQVDTERQVAFFANRGGEWKLAAKGALTPQSDAALSLIDPERLSEAILRDADATDQRESLFAGGWARHLFSGTGELLGLMVGLSGGPARPLGAHSALVESACCLAVLAIEQTNLIEELTFKGDHDSLTGLPNRGYYGRMLRSALRESARSSQTVALIYLNLDRFRLVNDVIGLAMGNRVLEQVARRLQLCLGTGPMLARMGADEFVVVLPGIAKLEDGGETARNMAGEVAARLLQSLSTSFSLDGHELFLSASIGIGCSILDSTLETLEREAYLALYEAKRAGKARAVHFHSSMAGISPERLEMEKRLRFALAREEFIVYYQPQIGLLTGQIGGMEALLRWRPEGLGLLSPAVFVPILEETGLIVDVGRWVLLEACRQGKEWLDKDGVRLRIGVNVSAVQLLHPDFSWHVEEALAETGYPPELLEIELTESVFIGEFATASRVLKELQAMGIGIALDDFGTGQSSLSYLDRLPFDRLKIDQSFIRGIGDGDHCPPIVHNIVQMAESLGMGIVAEGVETPHQAELLRLQGCEEGQGFFFSKARPPEDAVDFCRKYRGEFAETGRPVGPANRIGKVGLRDLSPNKSDRSPVRS